MLHKNSEETWYFECNQHGIGTAFALKDATLLHSEQTSYQKIEIYETKTFGRLLLLDGIMMLTDKDNFLYHEMMTHPALFIHPEPKNVVIIGGGDCGSLQEILKHSSIQKAVQIEIDRRVTEVSEEFFPALCKANADKRAHFEFCDGIAWMKEAPSLSVDVIIIDSTDPIGPAVGLYVSEFYEQCFRVLGEQGILVQQSDSPLVYPSHICNIHREMKMAGFPKTMLYLFPQPVYPSGFWSGSMGFKNLKAKDFRKEASQRKPFATKYYDAKIHEASQVLPPFVREFLALDEKCS